MSFSTKQVIILTGIISVFAIGGALSLPRDAPQIALAHPPNNAATAMLPAAFVRQKNAQEPSAFAPLPAGVDAEQLDTNAWKLKGRDPLVNPDLIRIFDQILGHAGIDVTHANEQELAYLHQALEKRVPAQYWKQAKILFANYLQYTQSLSGSRSSFSIDNTQADVLQGVIKNRQQAQLSYFNPQEVLGLFGDANREDLLAVERLKIQQRDDLSDAQKSEAFARASENMLTAEQLQARQTALFSAQFHRETQSLKQADATPEQLLAYRSASYGSAAAQRLAQVDQQEADWQAKITQLAAASPATQQQLRSQLFAKNEQPRLDAALALYALENPKK